MAFKFVIKQFNFRIGTNKAYPHMKHFRRNFIAINNSSFNLNRLIFCIYHSQMNML